MFSFNTLNPHTSFVNTSFDSHNNWNNACLGIRNNPFEPTTPTLGYEGRQVYSTLFKRFIRPVSAYDMQQVKATINNEHLSSLEKLRSIFCLPESDERDQLLRDRITEGDMQNASCLGVCILGISAKPLREEALHACLYRPQYTLHAIISQCEVDIQGPLLRVLGQHSQILLRLIEQEGVPFFWRLYYTCMLPSEVTLGERNAAEQCTLNSLNPHEGHSALAILEDVKVAIKHYPHSISRNFILGHLIEQVHLFTPAQRIELLSLIGESPAKNQKALNLSQEAGSFTLEQQKACVACMSSSLQKEEALRNLDIKKIEVLNEAVFVA